MFAIYFLSLILIYFKGKRREVHFLLNLFNKKPWCSSFIFCREVYLVLLNKIECTQEDNCKIYMLDLYVTCRNNVNLTLLVRIYLSTYNTFKYLKSKNVRLVLYEFNSSPWDMGRRDNSYKYNVRNRLSQQIPPYSRW